MLDTIVESAGYNIMKRFFFQVALYLIAEESAIHPYKTDLLPFKLMESVIQKRQEVC